MTRSLLRENIFKLLFRVEFNSPEDMPEQEQLFLSNDEEGLTPADSEYISNKYERIAAVLPELDAAISERTEGWTIDRIGKIDLTILRLALFEIRYDEDIPTSVAINEAVELAKKFGREESSSFVNGVLKKFAD